MMNPELAKRDGESDLQYHRRLVYGKLVDKTLADVDFAELSELVYGQRFTSDECRKRMYGSRATLDVLDKDGLRDVTGNEILKDIEEKTAELQKERIRLFDQRREYRKMITSEGRFDHLCDCLSGAAEELNQTIGLVYSDVRREEADDDDVTTDEAVLVLSDWHYGMIAENAFNKYNTDICRKRVSEVFDAAIKRIELHGCKHVKVIVLGDLFHGAIHVGARVASEELVCDQLMQVSEILAQSIVEIGKHVDTVDVFMTYGNHARTVQNKNDSIHRDNMERVIPWWIQQRVKDFKNITVHEDDGNEFLIVNVCGHTICAAHGDLDAVRTSPRMLYTLFSKTIGVDVEYILLGDKHHQECFEELGITSMICGSLCGTDDYANSKRLFSLPSQSLLIFNWRDGLDAEYRLRCGL